MLPRIIALCGYAKSGKDAVAASLPPEYCRIAFADELKRRAAVALGVERWAIEANKDKVRDALVAIGAGARLFDPLHWVKHVEAQLCRYPRCWVIPDCRYPNEAEMVRKHGGGVVYISRPGIEAANAEELRTVPLVRAMADIEIVNDSTPQAAAERLVSFYKDAA